MDVPSDVPRWRFSIQPLGMAPGDPQLISVVHFPSQIFFRFKHFAPPFLFKEMIWTDLDKTVPRPAIFYRDHSDVCSVRPTSCRKGIRRWRTNCSWSNWIWLCLNLDRSVSDTGQLVGRRHIIDRLLFTLVTTNTAVIQKIESRRPNSEQSISFQYFRWIVAHEM